MVGKRPTGQGPRRVCIAPCDVASYYSGLREGLEQAGVRTWFFSFLHNPYARLKPGPSAMWLERLVYAVSSWAPDSRSKFTRALREAALFPLRLAALTASLFCCDVFVFGFAMSFLGCRELPLLKLFGKRIICVFNGSESRPAWMSGLYTNEQGEPDGAAIAAEIARQRRRLARVERHADEIVCHPLSGQLLTRPFINHLELGHPFEPARPAQTPRTGSSGGVLKVVHAPTRPLQKGSAVFQAEIARLRSQGMEIEFRELTRAPNAEVLQAVAEADLVLDELYSDIPLAGLGSEAAALGTAVLVGGYAAGEALVPYLPAGGIPTGHFIHPSKAPELIGELLRDAGLRAEVARANAAFMRQHWTPARVAERLLVVLRSGTPSSWRCEPSEILYWQGWGAPEERTLRACAAVIRSAGAEALGISHNPRLLALIQVRIQNLDTNSGS